MLTQKEEQILNDAPLKSTYYKLDTYYIFAESTYLYYSFDIGAFVVSGNASEWFDDAILLSQLRDKQAGSIYTRDMKNRDALPTVGMKVNIINCNCSHIGVLIFISTEYTIIKYETGTEQHFHTRSIIFDPIEVKTPEQNQIESIVQDINSAMFDVSDQLMNVHITFIN